MIQFGICNEIFKDWSLDDTFAFAAKTGYDAVEIAPFTIAKHVKDISAAEYSALAACINRSPGTRGLITENDGN